MPKCCWGPPISNIFEDFRAQPAFTHRWYEHSHQQSGCTAALRLKTHVGMTPRPLSQQEQNQKTEVARIAPRISLLPAKLRFRVQVASYTLSSRTSKMSWGALFSGRPPDVTWFQIIFKMAVSGAYKDLRASVALTKFSYGDIVCLSKPLQSTYVLEISAAGLSMELE